MEVSLLESLIRIAVTAQELHSIAMGGKQTYVRNENDEPRIDILTVFVSPAVRDLEQMHAAGSSSNCQVAPAFPLFYLNHSHPGVQISSVVALIHDY